MGTWSTIRPIKAGRTHIEDDGVKGGIFLVMVDSEP